MGRRSEESRQHPMPHRHLVRATHDQQDVTELSTFGSLQVWHILYLDCRDSQSSAVTVSALIYICIIHTKCPMVSVQGPVDSPLVGPLYALGECDDVRVLHKASIPKKWSDKCLVKKSCICTQRGPVPSLTRLLLSGYV